jgi:hypothetical protein
VEYLQSVVQVSEVESSHDLTARVTGRVPPKEYKEDLYEKSQSMLRFSPSPALS